MLSGKLSLLALSFLLGVHAKRSLESSSSSSSSSASNGSNTSTTTSGSSSSSSSSDGYNYYSASGSSSSRSGSHSGSSSESDIEVASRCRAKTDVHLVVNEPFGKKLGRIADYVTKKRVPASFVINGTDLVNSFNYKSRTCVQFVQALDKAGHDLIILPDNDLPIKEMNEKQLLKAVQRSAIGIQTAVKDHPLLVHIPGGLTNDSRGRKQAALLKKYGYSIVNYSKSVKSHGKSMKSLVRHRKKSHSRKHKSRKHHSGRRHSSRKHWRNEISSTTSSSSSDSSSSSSSSSTTEHCRRRHRRHRRHSHARGHIFYANHGRGLGKDIQRTIERLDHRGYTFVDVKTCTKKRPYRTVLLVGKDATASIM